ncbi:acyl-CoA dehydrogenase [Kineococcus sp. T13]|uniref:acyl-CoA dehydrogenase family protein n=1 Tax=Kineococcus vitellinus TaxID=2696565 RepID=UPI001412741E|nr:acyl-CoA dehydrogenase family protein [Kineococcus vitellinus]NAZ74477.1 acyl-CoA dehydrogenase [Kineococcus vitellinus]
MTSPTGVDYFDLAADLTDDERAVWAKVRAFVDAEVLPVAAGFWERAEMPLDLLKSYAALDLVGDALEGPGVPRLSHTAAGLVTMELSRGDGSFATMLGVQAGLAMRTIAFLGSPEQKERWLPPMARLEALGAFALTEPEHGSDAVALATTARRDGDSYVLDGAKRWIGFGTVCDVCVVWARGEDGQVQGFLVERGTPGFEARVIEGKASLRAIHNADITLSGVRVPAANRLPGANSFRDTGRVLSATRAGIAWGALGHATAAYETALAYALERRQFGQPLASFQLVQDKLVQMLAEVTAMQLFCVRVGRLADAGRLTDTQASLAKVNATRKARTVTAMARDLLGGNGILLEHRVARHMADVEALHTYEGTESIQTLIVGRHLTGISSFT